MINSIKKLFSCVKNLPDLYFFSIAHHPKVNSDTKTKLVYKNRLLSYVIVCSFITILFPTALSAKTIDLTKNDIYVRKGFSSEWTGSIPSDPIWKKIPGTDKGHRPLRVKELGLDTPKRRFLSIKKYPPGEFTFVTSFNLTEKDTALDKMPGLFIGQIGINWEIYLNGRCVKREMHVIDKEIIIGKNTKDLLVYLDPRVLRPGENILACRILGDPTYVDTGFYDGSPYIIDNYETLLKRKEKLIEFVLIFLYLFVGIYHLMLYVNRPSKTYNLHYSIMSVLFFGYQFLISTHAHDYIPDTNMMSRLEFATLFLFIPAMGFFLDTILNDRIGPFLKGYSYFSALLAVLVFPFSLSFNVDVLRVWQITLVFPLFYFLYITINDFAKALKADKTKYSNEKKQGLFFSILVNLKLKVSGNMLIGLILLTLCAMFDIIDTIYKFYDFRVSNYGFFIFVIGITFILSNRFVYIHNTIEKLNQKLQKKIRYLDSANTALSMSEEKYRILVEGSSDIIFTCDEKWNIKNVNNALKEKTRFNPDKKQFLNFLNLLFFENNDIRRGIIMEQLNSFVSSRKPIQFTANFKTMIKSEPIKMQARFEYINISGKNEILGKISSIPEDPLKEYFISEKQSYSIRSYIILTDEMTNRMTRNLVNLIDEKDINLIRFALREIIINAIEHGNLEISFDQKSELLATGNYFNHIATKRLDAKYADRKVTIDFSIDNELAVYRIKDDGNGFDYKKMMELDIVELNENQVLHGRGIILTRNIFDEVKYNEKGNEVTLIKYIKKSNNKPAGYPFLIT